MIMEKGRAGENRLSVEVKAHDRSHMAGHQQPDARVNAL